MSELGSYLSIVDGKAEGENRYQLTIRSDRLKVQLSQNHLIQGLKYTRRQQLGKHSTPSVFLGGKKQSAGLRARLFRQDLNLGSHCLKMM